MATNFLWAAGTSNSGLLVPAFNLMTTELKSLTNASVIVSSVNGASGKFTNSNTAQGVYSNLYYYAGNVACTPSTVGGGLTGWFLTSPDSGTTLEPNNAAPARPPDFTIPLPTSALSTTNTTVYASQGRVILPALQFYVLIQNNCGVTLGAGGTTSPFLLCAPSALQY